MIGKAFSKYEIGDAVYVKQEAPYLLDSEPREGFISYIHPRGYYAVIDLGKFNITVSALDAPFQLRKASSSDLQRWAESPLLLAQYAV